MPRVRTRRAIALLGLAVVVAGAAVFLARRDGPRGSATPASDGAADAPAPLAARGGSAPEPGDAVPAGQVRLSPIDPALAGRGGVTFRVVRATDRGPVAGASAALYGTGHGSEPVRVLARSGADGRVVMRDVPAAAWLTLTVEAPGERPVSRADVDVVRGETVDLGDFAVGARRTLRVTVWDERSRPLAGADVSTRAITRDDEQMLSRREVDALLAWPAREGGTASSRSNVRGEATFEGVVPGLALVTASSPGRATVMTIVDVPAATDPTIPALILRSSRSIAGRVIDGRGAGVVDARVIASDPSGSLPDSRRSLARWTDTDATGRFDLALPASAVPGGLWVGAAGKPTEWRRTDAFRDDLLVTMDDGVEVEVVATDAATGKPLDGATVELRVRPEKELGTDLMPACLLDRGPWTWEGKTDVDGRARWTAPRGELVSLVVRHGWHRLGRAPAGERSNDTYQTLVAPTQLRDGPVRVEARLTMRRTIPVEGVVRSADGAPVAGVAIHSQSYGWWPPEIDARSDATGTFRSTLALREDESLSLEWMRVAAPGLVVRDPWVRFPPDSIDEVARAEIVVIPSMTVRGRIVDEHARPNAGADVRLASRGNGHGVRPPDPLSDIEGRFIFQDVEVTTNRGEPEQFRVVASSHGFATIWGEFFDAAPGRTVDVGDIVAPVGARVDGIVLDLEGRPAGGARVALWPTLWMSPPGPDVRYVVTDASGRFGFFGLREGEQREAVVEPTVGRETRTRFEVVASVKREPFELRMSGGVPWEGMVVDAAGRGLAGATVVVLLPQGRRDWKEEVETDGQGSFRFASVPSGVATVTVSAGTIGGTFENVDLPSSAPARLVATAAGGERALVLFDFEDGRAPVPSDDLER